MQALEDDLPVNELAEEDFDDGIRQNAIDFAANDKDNDEKLDFMEFCVFVRDREEGEFTDAELKARFQALDGDGSGLVRPSRLASTRHIHVPPLRMCVPLLLTTR